MDAKKRIEELKQEEKTLLLNHLWHMEQAAKHLYVGAISYKEMRLLLEIYKTYVKPDYTGHLFCGNCKMQILRGLYNLTKQLYEQQETY